MNYLVIGKDKGNKNKIYGVSFLSTAIQKHNELLKEEFKEIEIYKKQYNDEYIKMTKETNL